MARRNYTLRVHKDGTITFKSGRYVEHIDIRFIGYLETYERLKIAALTAGFSLKESTLEELLKEARGLKGIEPPKGAAGKKVYVKVTEELDSHRRDREPPQHLDEHRLPQARQAPRGREDREGWHALPGEEVRKGLQAQCPASYLGSR